MGTWDAETPLTIVVADEHCTLFDCCAATGLVAANPTSNAASRVGNTTHGLWPMTDLVIAIIEIVNEVIISCQNARPSTLLSVEADHALPSSHACSSCMCQQDRSEPASVKSNGRHSKMPTDKSRRLTPAGCRQAACMTRSYQASTHIHARTRARTLGRRRTLQQQVDYHLYCTGVLTI